MHLLAVVRCALTPHSGSFTALCSSLSGVERNSRLDRYRGSTTQPHSTLMWCVLFKFVCT